MLFIISGPVIAARNLSRVIVHETGHFFFCRLFRLAVYDVCFLRFGNPAGYVMHEPSGNFRTLFFVSRDRFSCSAWYFARRLSARPGN